MKLTIKTNYFRSLTCLLAVVAFLIFIGCQSNPPEHSRVGQALRGEKIFHEQCGSCHGDNPDKSAIGKLETPPPNLRYIMQRRGVEEFPIAEIARIIDGRNEVAAHGPRAMPVWGEVYSQEGLDEDDIRGKKGELVAYLMNIQKFD